MAAERLQQIGQMDLLQARQHHIRPPHALGRAEADEREAAGSGGLDAGGGVFDDDGFGGR